MVPKKWQLISKKDISPHKWFPLEMRTYKLPNGKIVDDFSVTTLADVSMIVPVTKENKLVLVKQFKPGMDDLTLEFPAGRMEERHNSFLELAQHELEEETGIKVASEQLKHFGVISGFTTKGSEKTNLYFATNLEFNSTQSFDENENIEVVQLTFQEMEEYIFSGKIWASQTIAAWELAKKHFSQELAF